MADEKVLALGKVSSWRHRSPDPYFGAYAASVGGRTRVFDHVFIADRALQPTASCSTVAAASCRRPRRKATDIFSGELSSSPFGWTCEGTGHVEAHRVRRPSSPGAIRPGDR